MRPIYRRSMNAFSTISIFHSIRARIERRSHEASTQCCIFNPLGESVATSHTLNEIENLLSPQIDHAFTFTFVPLSDAKPIISRSQKEKNFAWNSASQSRFETEKENRTILSFDCNSASALCAPPIAHTFLVQSSMNIIHANGYAMLWVLGIGYRYMLWLKYEGQPRCVSSIRCKTPFHITINNNNESWAANRWCHSVVCRRLHT